MNSEFWQKKRVLITGHTGFKGGWLSFTLKNLGAEIAGFSLPPNKQLNFYEIAGLKDLFSMDIHGDILDGLHLKETIIKFDPEIIFHLAAQPLVEVGYQEPLNTYTTNVLGLVNLFEASRKPSSLKAIINVTSDKCYINLNEGELLTEGATLGGLDPYSSSKACAELVSICYAKIFASNSEVKVNTARAGNVIGGGDFTTGRLMPDCNNALFSNHKMSIRNIDSTRPWQHVLEPLSGYLLLAEKLFHSENFEFSGWNFGPNLDSIVSVSKILEYIKSNYSYFQWETKISEFEEAKELAIDITKSKNILGWRPIWNVEEAIDETLAWYQANFEKKNMRRFTEHQIEKFFDNAA